MKCPSCDNPGLERAVKRCTHCGEAYVTEDLLILHQLEFLLKNTDSWNVSDALRAPYVERLDTLRARLVRKKPVKPEPVVKAEAAVVPQTEVAETAAVPVPEPSAHVAVPPPAPAPPKEKVPFDQWLLSERNIKIALYSGSVLLVAAGLIFVSVTWGRMPGPAKFAITLMITGLMYLAGYLLLRRPTLQIGGLALLAVASGFVVVDFAILQLYVLGPAGLRSDVMWLIASPLCLLLYVLTAWWTRAGLFTYISLVAVASTLTAALYVANAPWLAYIPAYALLAYTILWLVWIVENSPVADFTVLPLWVASQLGMVAATAVGFIGWATQTGCTTCPVGSPWLAILALGVGVIFYTTTDIRMKWSEFGKPLGIPQSAIDYVARWRPARWVAAILLPVTTGLALTELSAGDALSGLVMLLLALGYQGVGYVVERREKQRDGAWPLYTTGYAVALLVTAMAAPDADSLYQVLIGDVLLLLASAAIFRDYRWIYAAVWLLMLPVYLILYVHVPNPMYQGLLMGLMGLNYTVAGYVLGRRSLFLGGPFLSAAAFLSILSVVLTWGNPGVASVVLGVVALLYLAAALWLGWTLLLLPALLAVHLVILATNQMLVPTGRPLAWALTVSYGSLGLALLLGGLALRSLGAVRWGWPLYGVCVADLAGAYLAGLFLGGPLAIGVSAVMAVLLLSFAWLERAEFAALKLPPLLTYAGIAGIFVGHFYVLNLFKFDVLDVWPPFTAALCAGFVFLAWILRREPLGDLYGIPLRWAGLGLMAIPVLALVALVGFAPNPIAAVVTLTIAGLTLGFDGTVRRVPWLAWVTIGVTFACHFFVLAALRLPLDGVWPVPTAGLCAAFVLLAWLLRRHWLGDLYSLPLRWAGLALMAIPMLASMILTMFGAGPIPAVLALAIAGLTYGFDGIVRRVPWLAWVTVALVFVWQFFVQAAVGIGLSGIWPAITASVCAAFIALAWVLRGHGLEDLYGVPLRWGGLALFGIPLLGAAGLLLLADGAVLLAVTFSIAGLTYIADGTLRRALWLTYLGIGSLVVAIWGVLMALEVREPQAFVFPVGLTLLGIGWNERRHGRSLPYQGCSVPGMAVLMGTAFIQSLGPDGWPYALLLLAESSIAIGWGVWKHLKRCVQVGGFALLANAVVQLGPALVELSSWIQIGLTGAILLGVGMLALLRREEILAARQRLTKEWRQWEP
jgi:hypothetical protein